MGSYIKLDRKLLNWEWSDDPNTLALWIHILLQANWEERSWHGQIFERGTFPTSVAKLSEETGLTIKQTRTCLEHLKATNEVAIKATNRGTKIIVNKWEEYQCSDGQSGELKGKQTSNQTANKGQTKGNPLRKKERKEIKEIYKGYSDSFLEAMNAFKEMRKSIKKPLTDRAEQMILNRLSELATNEYQQIEIINQSVMNAWQNVYPIKPNYQGKRQDIIPTYDESVNGELDEERFNEIMQRRKHVS